MAAVQDQLEIKFRLFDGSEIGPKTYPSATSVATLKESIVADWPKEKGQLPKTVSDVKLISAGACTCCSQDQEQERAAVEDMLLQSQKSVLVKKSAS